MAWVPLISGLSSHTVITMVWCVGHMNKDNNIMYVSEGFRIIDNRLSVCFLYIQVVRPLDSRSATNLPALPEAEPPPPYTMINVGATTTGIQNTAFLPEPPPYSALPSTTASPSEPNRGPTEGLENRPLAQQSQHGQTADKLESTGTQVIRESGIQEAPPEYKAQEDRSTTAASSVSQTVGVNRALNQATPPDGASLPVSVSVSQREAATIAPPTLGPVTSDV